MQRSLNTENIITNYHKFLLFNNFMMIIFIQLLNEQIQGQQLVYSNFFSMFTYQNDWLIQNGLGGNNTMCGTSKIFGGHNTFGSNTIISQTFALLPHKEIRIKFTFWHIDNWGGERLEIKVDNVIVHNLQYNSEYTKPSICGTSGSAYGDGVDQVDLTVTHTNLNVQIMINGQENYWGISEFELWTDECFVGCNTYVIQNNFKQSYLSQQFNRKAFQLTDRYLDNLIILTYSSCIEQQKMDQLENYIKKEYQFNGDQIICISIKQVNTMTNPFAFSVYLNNQDVHYSRSSNQLSSNVNCDLDSFNEFNIFLFNHMQSTIKIQISGFQLRQQNSQIYILGDFSLFEVPLNFQQCLDHNQYPFDGCFSGLYDCIQGCDQCIKGLCIECQSGWQYQIELQTCIPICGNKMITYDEECDDGNFIQYDGCFNCRFSCPQFCDKCQFGNCLSCYPNYELFENTCKEMDTSLYQQHEFYYVTLSNQFAYPILPYIYSYNLKKSDNFAFLGYQYTERNIQNCLNQIMDVCLECNTFYILSQNKQNCIPQCDDGITIEYEICDDKNNIQFDGCYKCQSNCQLQCKLCLDQKCYTCIDGWQLINFGCYEICGDGELAISSSEQCDDGNYNPNDGCYNCKYECNQNCFSCALQSTCLFCIENFQTDENNRCFPICGDGIIIQGLEECEDFNDIQYDGCYQCQFQCVENCNKCIQGICQECNEGYDLRVDGCNKILTITQEDQNEEILQYQLVCGDGKLQNQEECDDGNQYSSDGCSILCKLEENWNCNQDYPNICFLKTKFSLQYKNQTYQHQYVQLSFSNLVKQTSNLSFTQYIAPEIINLNVTQYEIIINPVVNVYMNNFTMALFDLDIQIFEQVATQPNLQISINSQLIDQNYMTVDLAPQTMLLLLPKVLSQSQINVANRFQVLGNAIMIGLGSISLVMLIFGNPQQSVEIFDVLQFQSFLKFINVIYPENVKIYFQSSEIVTITPILITFKITNLLNNLISDNYIESIGKLQEYELNADLLTNIYSQLSQIALIALLYFILKLYSKFYFQHCFSSKYFYYIRVGKSKWLEQLAFKFYILNKKVRNLQRVYGRRGLRDLFYANCWDILFKVLLYLKCNINPQSDYRSIISYIICSIVLSSVLMFLCLYFKGLSRKVEISSLRSEQHEGIVLFKKLFFIFILIHLQSQAIMQCVMISLLTLGYIGVLFTINLKIQKLELVGIIWNEVPVLFFTLSSIMYCSDFQSYSTSDQQVLLGFGQIGVLIIGLLGPIIKFGFQLYNNINKFYLRIQEKKKTQQKHLNSFIFEIQNF